MTKQFSSETILPLNAEQLSRLQTATGDFSPLQLAWLSGYFWKMGTENQPVTKSPSSAMITLLSASQSGNARRLSEQLRDDLIAAKINVVLINAGDYKFKQISHETVLIIITSTQGQGDPPEEAVALYNFLFSKKAPSLSSTKFAVFGLGDSSYDFFAKAGKDLDFRLAELGAQRLHDRVDGDVDYHTQAESWRNAIVEQLKLLAQKPSLGYNQLTYRNNINNFSYNTFYTKEAPFTARLSLNQKITSRESCKDVRHIEIDLTDSGMYYQPGDALGVWYENDSKLIDEILSLLSININDLVHISGQNLSITEALKKHYELTQNNPKIVQKYASLTMDKDLLAIASDANQLNLFALSTPIVDMVSITPTKLCADQLISMLRPMTPRLYSIASSQKAVGEEVHITVGVIRYNIHKHLRSGGASSYLADRLKIGDTLQVFIERNDNFRLPVNSKDPIIMIGPGTGIAPFRAFLQQREAEGAEGENWLFFGNPRFINDFLYQVEWQSYVKDGILTKIDLAWSRDQDSKVYVQDKLIEKGPEVWRWIHNNAYIYVCGDAKHMARDVDLALKTIISEHGKMNLDQAEEFLSEMRIARRYQRDVY